MDNIESSKKIKSYEGWGKVLHCVLAVLLLMSFYFAGAYIGTQKGIEIATNAALEFLEYKAADPAETDPSLLNSEPAAVYGEENAERTVIMFTDQHSGSGSFSFFFLMSCLSDSQADVFDEKAALKG